MKVLFLVAHPDDESYGPYGTIIKHVRAGDEVEVHSLCNGKRPGTEEVSEARVKAFNENVNNTGALPCLYDNSDLTLNQFQTTNFVTDLINDIKPHIVYTHDIGDINKDHRIVAEAALVGCRPKSGSSVKTLYFFEVPSSTDWSFAQFTPTFQPNTYINVPVDILNLKRIALSRYDTETYNYPDARSIEAMITLLKYRGYQIGYNYAESFKLVFSRG